MDGSKVSEEKKQIQGALYEQEKIEQVLNILNTISVVGLNQIKALGTVFDILLSPIPFKSLDEDKDSKK